MKAHASQSYTLPSPTSQRYNQSLSKSMSVPTHGRQERSSKLEGKMTENKEHQAVTKL